jgi:hypothetical protein
MTQNWFSGRRIQGLNPLRRRRSVLPRLERLEDRTLFHIPAPTFVIHQTYVDNDIAPALMNNLPMITSSLGAASNIPIIGTALAKSLTTDNLTANLVQDVLNNLRELPPPSQMDPNPDLTKYENYTDMPNGNMLSLTVDTVHEHATETVPFSLPLRSFLTLSNPLPQVTVQIDIYYAMAAQITFDPLNPLNPVKQVEIVDSDLTQNFQQFPGVTLPHTSMAIIEKATLPPGFTATGMLNGVLPVTFTDHGDTNYQGTIALNFGSFDSKTGTPAPQGSLDGAALFDVDATTQFADAGKISNLPFNPTFKTEVVGNWAFAHTPVAPQPASPLGTLNSLELRNVQLDVSSLSSLAGTFVQKIQSVLDKSSLRKFRNTMDTEIPIINVKLRDLAQGLGLISGSANNLLSALDAIDAISVPSTPPPNFVSLGSYQISDPRPASFAVSAEGDVPPADSLDLVNQFNAALGLVTGSAPGIGLDLPLLTDPAHVLPTLFELAAGASNTADVNLVTLKLPSLDFTLGPSLPVFIPGLPVLGSVGLQGQINVHLQADFGYDTAGLRELINDPTQNGADLLDGLYTIPANTQFSAQGQLTLSAGEGIIAQGGLYASAQMQPAGTPETGTGKVHIGAAVDDPGCFFTGSGKIYAEADVGVGANLPLFGTVGFTWALSHHDLFVFEKDCDDLVGDTTVHPILPVGNHILLLDTSRLGETNLAGALDSPEIRVHTFERKQLFDKDKDLYSGIEVDYPGSSDLYIERDSLGKYNNYYDVIATNAPTPISGIIDVTDPFGEAALPSGDTPEVILFGGSHDDTFVYHDDPNIVVKPHVLFVGEGGNNKLIGADLAFGGFIPTTPATLQTQAKGYVPASGSGLTSGDQSAQATINTQMHNAISDTATTGRDVLIGTHTAILVGGSGVNSFDETGGGDYQFYGGTGGNNFTVRLSVNGVRSTYTIHGAGDPANNLLTVIQGDDTTVQASSLQINVNATSVADETNSKKMAVAIDDGTQPPFVTAHDIGKVTVDPASPSIPITTGIGKLTDTTVQNLAYNPSPGPTRPGDTVRFLGTASADTFNVDEVNIPNIAPLPGYFFDFADRTGAGGYGDVDSDPRPVATDVAVTYGDDHTTTHFTLLGMQAADHLALAGGAGQDSYNLKLSAGTYYTTDIEDTDQTPATGPTGASDLTIVGVQGNDVRQDTITLNNSSATFAYHQARLANLHSFDFNHIAINSLDDFRNNYRPLIEGEIVPDVSDPVFYSPTVNWGAGIKAVAILSGGTFSHIVVNRPAGNSNVTLTMEPSQISAGSIVQSQIAAYSDRYFPPPATTQPVELLDPRAVMDIQANAGNFTFDDRVGGSTINVGANTGTFTLAGTSTSPMASAVVAADVAAGASLIDTVNILANSGAINLDHKGVGLASYDYIHHPDQITFGTGGSLGAVQGTVSLQGSGELVAVNIDDSKDTGPGIAWTMGPGGVSSPTFAFQISPSSDPVLQSLNLNVNAGSSVHVTGTPMAFAPSPLPLGGTTSWTVNGADVNNTLQGPDKSNTWQITGPDSGVLNDPLIYTGFNNLTGGAQDDTFAFMPGGSISGIVDGGPGHDALDYLAYSPPPVHVDLQAGQATAVGKGIQNIETAILFSLLPLSNIPNISEGVRIPDVQVPTNNPLLETLTYSDLVNGQHTLPAGLSIDPTSGVISGTPGPGAAAASPYAVTITVTDGLATKILIFSWAVSPAVTVTSPDPQRSGAGQAVTPLQIQATDSLGGTLSFTDVVNGKHTLPPGLSIGASGNGAGLISGTLSMTADANSPYSVTITATDGTYSGSTTFMWTVLPFYQFIPILGNNQSTPINTDYAIPFEARLTDGAGNPVPFVQVSMFAPSDPTGRPFLEPSGTFQGGTPFAGGVTDTNGVFTPFTLPFTANAFAGSFNVRAQAAIGTGPVALFHLTNLPPVVPAVQMTSPPIILATQSASYNLSATVPASVNKPAYRIDWGDGTPGAPDIQFIPVPSSNGGAISAQHVYDQPAAYQAIAQIVDGSGATVVTGNPSSIQAVPVNAANMETLVLSAPSSPITFQVISDAETHTVLAAFQSSSGFTIPPGVNQVVSTIDVTPLATPLTDLNINVAPQLSLLLSGNGATVQGHSPALEVDGGNVTLDGFDLTTATSAPVILVTGGSLTIRNSTITATGSSPTAIQVTGGTVNLGTAADPGNSVLDSTGPGNLIQNTSGNNISAVGDTFQVGGVPLTSNYRIADQILDGRDAGGSGLVTFVTGNLYVTAQTGSIQPAIDAAPAGTTIHVESAVYPGYDTHGKNVAILFTVASDPGTYTGNYTVAGQGSFTGPTTLELAPGVYTVDNGAGLGGSSFDFQVDALGNVTSLDPLTAVGGLGTLSFRTAAVTIDPGAFAGAYTLSGFGSTLFTGPQSVNLIAGLYYDLTSAAGGGSFTFQLDGAGNVVAVNSTAATGTGTTLGVATIPVAVDPGGYTGSYTVGGTTVAGGPAIVPVIVGQATPVSVAGQTGTITADSSGVSPGRLAFTVSGQSYTFNFGANRAPTASAGGPYTVAEGGSLTLNASASSDPDGDPLTYSWDINGDGVFGDATGATPTLTWAQLNALGINDGPGTFSILVQVDDGHGHVVTSPAASLTITNTPPTASVSGPTSIALGQSLAVNLSAVDPSPADQSAGFSYTINWGDSSAVYTIPAAPGNGAGMPVSHPFPAPGTYTVQVTATDKDGGVSSPVMQTVVVGPAADTVAVTGAPAPSTYGQLATFTAGVTPSALNVGIPTGAITFYDGATVLGTVALVNGSAIYSTATLPAGLHAIHVSYSGDTDFQSGGATQDGGQTVNPAPLTITADNSSKTYGTANPTFTVHYAGFANGDGPASLGGTLSFSTAATTASGAGSYTVTPGGLSSANYAITFVAGTLTVNPAVLTVTANNASKVYGDGIPAFTASITGFVNGDNSSAYTGAPSLTTTATASSPVGSYAITAAQGTLSAANYTFAFVNGTLSVTQATPVLSVSDASGTYTGNPFPATATVAGVVTGMDDTPGATLEGTGLTLAYYSGATAGGTALAGAPSAPGTYTVVASFAGSTDYKPGLASVVFTINQSNQGAPTASIADGDFGGDTSGVRGQVRSFLLSAADSSGTKLASATFTVNWGDGQSQSFINLSAATPVSHTWSSTGNYTIGVTAIVNGQSSQVVSKTIAIKIVDYQLVQTDSVTGATSWALVAGGSTHSNVIEIENDAGAHLLDVEIENAANGQYEYHQAFADSVNGASVGRLILYGQASDVLMVASGITINAELHASSTGNSILKAGGGNDILIGGAGNDILIGGKGRDILIGGFGNDLIIAGTGDDIVIAGTTSYSHNDLALRSILSEWASTDSYATRVSDIQGQTHTGADLNGTYFLNSSTVQDDKSIDVLVGGSGRDWFFADTTGQTGPCDIVLGLHAGDTVTNV